jgi:hypothetical protein
MSLCSLSGYLTPLLSTAWKLIPSIFFSRLIANVYENIGDYQNVFDLIVELFDQI